MLQRKFGRSGHMSSIAILGAAAFGNVDKKIADETMQTVMEHGVNHIDIAPSYGNAEQRLSLWIEGNREKFFVGCKTLERSYQRAKNELHTSLEKLGCDHFDLYQIHAVKDLADLDSAMKKGGALEAFIEAKQQGFVKHIGITGHRAEIPLVLSKALERFDFDSVLFPVSFGLFSFPEYKKNASKLLETCKEQDIAVMAIKYMQKAPWGDHEQTFDTWYQPFTADDDIQTCVNFTLSQHVTGIPTAGDVRLIGKVLEACENFQPMTLTEQNKLTNDPGNFKPLYPTQ